jgi:hypothetical protein
VITTAQKAIPFFMWHFSTRLSSHGLPDSRGCMITLIWTAHPLDSSGRVSIPTQRLLSDNTQHSQETDIHATRGIRTNNPSKQTAEDPRLRPRGHWDQQTLCLLLQDTEGKGFYSAHKKNRYFTQMFKVLYFKSCNRTSSNKYHSDINTLYSLVPSTFE